MFVFERIKKELLLLFSTLLIVVTRLGAKNPPLFIEYYKTIFGPPCQHSDEIMLHRNSAVTVVNDHPSARRSVTSFSPQSISTTVSLHTLLLKYSSSRNCRNSDITCSRVHSTCENSACNKAATTKFFRSLLLPPITQILRDIGKYSRMQLWLEQKSAGTQTL